MFYMIVLAPTMVTKPQSFFSAVMGISTFVLALKGRESCRKLNGHIYNLDLVSSQCPKFNEQTSS
jgi:hypothetical protein